MATWVIHCLRPWNGRFLTTEHALNQWHFHSVSLNVIQENRPVETGVVNDDELILQVASNPLPLRIEGLERGGLFVGDAVYRLRFV